MSNQSAQLRELAELYTAAWCSRNAASVAAFLSPSGSLSVNDADPAVGRGAITEVAQGFMTAFPDLKVLMDGLDVQADCPAPTAPQRASAAATPRPRGSACCSAETSISKSG